MVEHHRSLDPNKLGQTIFWIVMALGVAFGLLLWYLVFTFEKPMPSEKNIAAPAVEEPLKSDVILPEGKG